MAGLRAVLVAMPSLLADIIRHALTGSDGIQIIAEIADPGTAAARLRALAPDVVLVGPVGPSMAKQPEPGPDAAAIRSTLPRARVLELSADLTRILGPGEGDEAELTLDSLTDRLRGPTI